MGQIVIEEVLSNILIDDNEVVEYYNQNTEFFNEQEQISAKHILVDSEEKANKVFELINNGLPFEIAAKEHSSCPSKDQGGNLGVFGKGMMVPEFEKAAFGSNIGEITQPVKTQFGYHLILVEEKIEPKEKSFEEVKESIKGHLAKEKQNNAYLEFVNSLKNKYNVVIK